MGFSAAAISRRGKSRTARSRRVILCWCISAGTGSGSGGHLGPLSCGIGLGKDAAEYLVAKKVAAAATDALSIDVSISTDFPAHYTLLASQVLIGENFNNLGSPPPFSLLMAFPLKIQDGSGSPVRAVAFIPRKRE